MENPPYIPRAVSASGSKLESESSGSGYLFISYSRNDKPFLTTFVDALKERGLEVWVDWEGIAPSEEWMARIIAAIGGADAFVFLISPDSVSSEVCSMELDYAVQNNKRMLPVLHRDTEAEPRREIAELNWVFARDVEALEGAIASLKLALNTDLDWVREHSRVLIRAREWDRHGRESSYTLRGRDLRSLQQAVTESPKRTPQLTELQRTYMEASRRAEIRRRTTFSLLTVLGLAVAAFFAYQAWHEKEARIRQAEISAANQIVESGSRSTHELIDALITLNRYGEPTLAASTLLRESTTDGGEWIVDDEYRRVLASDITANGQKTALFAAPDKLLVYDNRSGAISAECVLADTAIYSGTLLSLSEDAQYVAVLGREFSSNKSFFQLSVWSLPSCELTHDLADFLAPDTSPQRLVVLSSGDALMLQTDRQLYAVDPTTGALSSLENGKPILAFDVSPDEEHYLTAVRGDTRPSKLSMRNRQTDEVESQWMHPRIPRGIQGLSFGMPGISIRNGVTTLYDRMGNIMYRVQAKGDHIAWSPNGTYFASSEGDPTTLVVGDSLTGKIVASTTRNTRISQLGFTGDGQSVVAVGDSRSSHAIWKFTSGGRSPRVPYAVLEGPHSLVSLVFAADSKTLVAAGKAGSLSWSIPAGNVYGRPNQLESVSPEEDQAPGPDATDTKMAEGLALGRTRLDLRARLSVLPPDRRGTPRLLELWEGETKVAAKALMSSTAPIKALFLTFTPDDRYLVYQSERGWEMVETNTLQLYTVIQHPGAIDFAASADGRYILSRDGDQVALAWQAVKLGTTGHAKVDVGLDSPLMAVSNDGRWMATAGPDGRVLLWALGVDELLAQACHWVGRSCD